jgi:hypothetical protein
LRDRCTAEAPFVNPACQCKCAATQVQLPRQRYPGSGRLRNGDKQCISDQDTDVLGDAHTLRVGVSESPTFSVGVARERGLFARTDTLRVAVSQTPTFSVGVARERGLFARTDTLRVAVSQTPTFSVGVGAETVSRKAQTHCGNWFWKHCSTVYSSRVWRQLRGHKHTASRGFRNRRKQCNHSARAGAHCFHKCTASRGLETPVHSVNIVRKPVLIARRATLRVGVSETPTFSVGVGAETVSSTVQTHCGNWFRKHCSTVYSSRARTQFHRHNHTASRGFRNHRKQWKQGEELNSPRPTHRHTGCIADIGALQPVCLCLRKLHPPAYTYTACIVNIRTRQPVCLSWRLLFRPPHIHWLPI